jgi:hypothetical protein
VKPGRRWEARRGEIWRWRGLGSAGVGWERGLTNRARTSVRGEQEGTEDERHESKWKAYSVEYAKGWDD